MKLHLACGQVYLDGWINLDRKIENYSFLKEEMPDLLEYNRTTLDKYYKYPLKKREHELCVVDEFLDLTKIPYPFEDNSAESIAIVSSLEHFEREEAINIIKESFRILKKGGELIIGVPDLRKTISDLEDERWDTFNLDPDFIENIEFTMRLIYGSHKNEYSYHKWGYTEDSLKDICKKIGFLKVKQYNGIKFDFPTVSVIGIK